MKFIASTVIVSTLLAISSAKPVTNLLNDILGALDLNGLVGNGTPPLATTIHSPQCADLNNGTYVCCQSTFNGGMPLVADFSELTDYPLTKNSINGLIDCKTNFDTCDPGSKLCCGMIDLIPTLAMYCQQAN